MLAVRAWRHDWVQIPSTHRHSGGVFNPSIWAALKMGPGRSPELIGQPDYLIGEILIQWETTLSQKVRWRITNEEWSVILWPPHAHASLYMHSPMHIYANDHVNICIHHAPSPTHHNWCFKFLSNYILFTDLLQVSISSQNIYYSKILKELFGIFFCFFF